MVVLVQTGDADTNDAVAGALLGCKLGVKCFPETCLQGLCHKKWLDGHIKRSVLCRFHLLHRPYISLHAEAEIVIRRFDRNFIVDASRRFSCSFRALILPETYVYEALNLFLAF